MTCSAVIVTTNAHAAAGEIRNTATATASSPAGVSTEVGSNTVILELSVPDPEIPRTGGETRGLLDGAIIALLLGLFLLLASRRRHPTTP